MASTRDAAPAIWHHEVDSRLCAVSFVYASLIVSALAAFVVAVPAGLPWWLLLGALCARWRVLGRGRCRHDLATVGRDLSPNEALRAGALSEWVCDDCGVLFTRKEPVEQPQNPVALLFEEIEVLGLKDVVAERDLFAKRLRGLETYLAEHNITVEWKDGKATSDVLTREEEAPTRQARERLRALGIEVAEERSARWQAEAEAERLKGELAGLRKSYDATRANLAAACGECVDATTLSDERPQFRCTGRGGACSSKLSNFQLLVDAPLSDDDVHDILSL